MVIWGWRDQYSNQRFSCNVWQLVRPAKVRIYVWGMHYWKMKRKPLRKWWEKSQLRNKHSRIHRSLLITWSDPWNKTQKNSLSSSWERHTEWWERWESVNQQITYEDTQRWTNNVNNCHDMESCEWGMQEIDSDDVTCRYLIRIHEDERTERKLCMSTEMKVQVLFYLHIP